MIINKKKTLQLALIGIMVFIGLVIMIWTRALPALAKEKRTYYTPEKISIMKRNLEKYDWARQMRDEIISRADYWLKYSDARLQTLVPPASLARAITVNNLGCPQHGQEIYQKGSYPWIIDFENPWKIKCPIGGEEYPSNDFAKFLASDLKDSSLLTGEYPDDGWGWQESDNQKKYWFVAYYVHWSVQKFLLPAIWDLSQAYLLTENEQYAHKCALLLWQLSQYYPDYQYENQSRYGTEFDRGFLGKLLYHTWEVASVSSTETHPPLVDTCALAYDAIAPFLQKDQSLQQLTNQTSQQIELDIRERLLLEMARAITDGSHRLYGNYGTHQRALVRLAIVLDESQKTPTSAQMINWLLNNQKVSLYTDLGLNYALVNLIFRDGVPSESPIYNYTEWLASLTQIAEDLLERRINLFQDERFQKLLSWHFNVCLGGEFMPALGDSGDMFAFNNFWNLQPEILRIALEHTADPRFAAALKKNENLPRNLFKKPVEETLNNIPTELTTSLCSQSINLPGYGLANLQTSNHDQPTACSLFYGNYSGHQHQDRLNLTLFSYGNALLTDFGYPETADSFDARRFGFFNNTLAHNTVVVNAHQQKTEARCRLNAFDAASFAKIVDASCEDAYADEADLYRRANILIEANPEQSYVFDVFYVAGGEQHDYFTHGTQADFSCQPPLGPPENKGTLAGSQVPYGQFYDDPQLEDKPLGTVSYGGYTGSGYQFLFNVQKKSLEKETAVCEWRLTEPIENQRARDWQSIGLRAHLVSDNEELIAAAGRPQQKPGMPETVQFMLRRRKGENLKSHFVTIFEPYKNQTWIKQVSPVAIEPNNGQAAAVLVELVNGQKHYLFHSLEHQTTYTLDQKIQVKGQAACLIFDASKKPIKAMLFNGYYLSWGNFFLEGKGPQETKISSVDYQQGIIKLTDPVLSSHLKKNQTIIIAGSDFTDSLSLEKVINRYQFSIGNQDLRVAQGTIEKILSSKNQFVSPTETYFTQPSMTVLNSQLQPQGRVQTINQKVWTIDRSGLGPLQSENFPANQDNIASYTVVVAGKGDQIIIPDLIVYQSSQQNRLLIYSPICQQIILIILAIGLGILLANTIEDFTSQFVYKTTNLVLGLGFKDKEAKINAKGVPIVHLRRLGTKHYNPVAVAMTARQHYQNWQTTQDKKHWQYFINCADWLIDNLKSKKFQALTFKVWQYDHPWSYNLKPPWISGLAQGVGVQILSLAYKLTKKQKYLQAAQGALTAFFVAVKNGGVTYKDKKNTWWYEEFVGRGAKVSRVLNGMLYALIGIYEYYENTQDKKAKQLFDKGINSLKHNLNNYDAGWWTYYDNLGLVASKSYHQVHLDLLNQIYQITKEKIFLRTYQRWSRYQSSFFVREFIRKKPNYHNLAVLFFNIGVVWVVLEIILLFIKL